jgi:hypothetical protein
MVQSLICSWIYNCTVLYYALSLICLFFNCLNPQKWIPFCEPPNVKSPKVRIPKKCKGTKKRTNLNLRCCNGFDFVVVLTDFDSRTDGWLTSRGGDAWTRWTSGVVNGSGNFDAEANDFLNYIWFFFKVLVKVLVKVLFLIKVLVKVLFLHNFFVFVL